MKDELLQYYNQELSYLRQQGEQFANAHPKIANRLKISQGKVEDPFAERLIEAFAFLTARLQYNLDEQYTHTTEALLNILYPHYLLGIPSLSIVQLNAKAQCEQAFTLAKHTKLRSQTIDDQTCYFKTAYATEVTPLTCQDAGLVLHQNKPHLSLSLHSEKHPISALKPHKLRFYIRAEQAQANKIYEIIFNQVNSIKLNGIDIPATDIKPVGFSDEENLLPYPKHSFTGYRLLTEYFAFPEKFLFFDLVNLNDYITDPKQTELTLQFELKQAYPDLEAHISKETFLLNCTPIINLFDKKSEPIRLNHYQTAYHVIADAQLAAEAIEIYQINDMSLSSNQQSISTLCHPYFGKKARHLGQENTLAWQATKKAGWEIGAHHLPGSETFINISDFNLGKQHETLSLTADLTCSNRDLPQQLPRGNNQPSFDLEESHYALVESIHAVHRVTPAKYRNKQHTDDIDLIAHLACNQIQFNHHDDSLTALKEILALYLYDDKDQQQMLELGLVALSTKQIMARHPDSLKYGFCQGTAFTLTIDESHLHQHQSYLLGCVIEQFLARSCSINSFTQLTITSKQRGDLFQWQPCLGSKATL